MSKSVRPKYYEKAFSCPRCGVLAPQAWYSLIKGPNNELVVQEIDIDRSRIRPSMAYTSETDSTIKKYRHQWDLNITVCQHCYEYTIWENQDVIFPFETEVPEPHEDMMDDVKGIYQEAALIYQHSPRAAAALLRLAIETMIPQLEEYNIKKGNLNTMIGELVKKDIPEHIQQGLDAIRIYGNEGIHAGEIVLNDDQEIVEYLFELVNYMIEELITKKKKLNSFYSKLPLNKLQGILKRDKEKLEK